MAAAQYAGTPTFTTPLKRAAQLKVNTLHTFREMPSTNIAPLEKDAHICYNSKK